MLSERKSQRRPGGGALSRGEKQRRFRAPGDRFRTNRVFLHGILYVVGRKEEKVVKTITCTTHGWRLERAATFHGSHAFYVPRDYCVVLTVSQVSTNWRWVRAAVRSPAGLENGSRAEWVLRTLRSTIVPPEKKVRYPAQVPPALPLHSIQVPTQVRGRKGREPDPLVR